jgi:predicted alpha/beta hydrolase family esterase
VKQGEKLNFEDHDPYRLGEQRLGEPAGIYLLAGCFHVAHYTSRAAADLHARGALLVATLSFSETEAERSVSGGAPHPRTPSAVRPRPTAALVERPAPN